MDKIRFRVYFAEPDPGREPIDSPFAGRAAVAEIAREQVATIAQIMDELAATAHAWNCLLDPSGDEVPEESLLVDAELTIALPLMVGDKQPPGWFDEDRPGLASLEIVGEEEPFEPTVTARRVKVDAGWMRAFLSVGGAPAPLPLDDLRRHFDLDAPETSAKPVTRVAFDRLVDLYRQMGEERQAAEDRAAHLQRRLTEAKWLIAEFKEERDAARARAQAVAKAADAEIARLTAELDAAIGRPVDEFLFGWPSEPVQLILNAVRGTKGDRWLVEPVGGGLPSIVKDELVAGWRRPVEKSSCSS